MQRRQSTTVMVLTLGLGAAILPLSAQAEDFFSALFGGFGSRPAPPPRLLPPFANEDAPARERPHITSYGRGQAWCVRSCDGRYFPVAGPDHRSRAELCSSFCPASPTNLVYGNDIGEAVTDSGQPYSDLPNAFRYRDELVAGCTCNGKDRFGLAQVAIENDPTLRKGDVLAGEKQLVVATGSADRRGGPTFTPLPKSMAARYRHVPVVASGR